MPVLTRHGGRLLAAEDRPAVIEGQWSGDRVVVVAFRDRDTFTRWAASAEYLEISKDRPRRHRQRRAARARPRLGCCDYLPGPPAKLCPVPAQLITMVALYGTKTGDLKRL